MMKRNKQTYMCVTHDSLIGISESGLCDIMIQPYWHIAAILTRTDKIVHNSVNWVST